MSTVSRMFQSSESDALIVKPCSKNFNPPAMKLIPSISTCFRRCQLEIKLKTTVCCRGLVHLRRLQSIEPITARIHTTQYMQCVKVNKRYSREA